MGIVKTASKKLKSFRSFFPKIGRKKWQKVSQKITQLYDVPPTTADRSFSKQSRKHSKMNLSPRKSEIRIGGSKFGMW